MYRITTDQLFVLYLQLLDLLNSEFLNNVDVLQKVPLNYFLGVASFLYTHIDRCSLIVLKRKHSREGVLLKEEVTL